MGRTQVPNSAPSRVHSAGATRAKGAPTKPEPQHRQQQHATSPKSQASAQVYRPTPVKEHPDDAFVTGAWLFDQSRVPQWMQAQLPTALSQMRSTAAVPKPVQQQKKHASSPSKVIRPAPVHEHPDTAFVSGAWLFDTARAPLWMQRQVPAVATALVVRSRRLAKALPVSRAQHRPRSTKHYAAALPSLQAFGATPHAVIPCGSVRARHAHPDDAFYSGAWMFDAKCAPSWLAQELKTASKLLQQVVHVQKQKTNHMQFAGVKLTSGRKLGV